MAGGKSSADAGGGAVYAMGLIGSAVYFIQAADGFWVGVLGVLKAIIWPGIIAFELLKSFYG